LRPLADKEFGILSQFASKEGHVEGQLESYDLEFWKNKHSVKHFKYSSTVHLTLLFNAINKTIL